MGKYFDWAVLKKAEIDKIRRVGGEIMAEKASTAGFEPPVDAGLFDYPEFVASGKQYTVNELFSYNGIPGFARQMHTSQDNWKPFAVGTESLYGARPRQNTDGTYPYIYNMLIVQGMRVVSVKDGAVYRCIQPYEESAGVTLLYDPADVPALFEREVL